jgi:proline dehydrogenase
MKFNREHLEELTLQKIKEVNDETEHQKSLEVPEMVNIIATIIEEQLLEEFRATTILVWENYLKKISDDILSNGESFEK